MPEDDKKANDYPVGEYFNIKKTWIGKLPVWKKILKCHCYEQLKNVTVFIVGHLCFVSNVTYTKIRFKFDVFYTQYTVSTMFVSAYDVGRISDPDPDWIRIQLGQWIRISIRNPNPDPGG